MKTCWFWVAITVLIGSCNPSSKYQEAAMQTIDVTVFAHGVASGDPLYDRVIIWTRVSVDTANVSGTWEVSSSDRFDRLVGSGQFSTSEDQDFTVKVDVLGLTEGTPYFYRFKVGEAYSPTGRTKTASMNPDSLRLAVVSCANYEWGYFTAYQKIAEKELLDAVVHLGDYIYEYEPGGYGDTTLGRFHEPAHELLTLQDYRIRYAQYRADPDLKSMHASQPFIAIWDDHEIANNTYKEGAENHQENEGDFEARKRAAVQAYYEWMPIREGDKLYRTFEYGSLAKLILLDERLEGRTRPSESIDDPSFGAVDQSMLGKEQLAWLQEELREDSVKWNIIGNQVIFSDLNQSAVFPDRPLNLDSWSGYPFEKNVIAKFIQNQRLENVVFITGDTHATWAMEVLVREVSLAPVAVEFGTPSISSSNYDEYSGLDTAHMAESLFQNNNPHLKYTNLVDHGYFILTLTNARAMARYYYVESVRKPNMPETMSKKFWVEEGSSVIKQFSLY